MSTGGAYPDEMNETALFTDALRVAVPTRPDPEVRTLLVPRLAEVARVATLEAEARARARATPVRDSLRLRSRRALVARVAVVVALIPLVLAGLAFAGVTVPTPAKDAFESVGVTLPNQPSDNSRKAPATTQPNPSSTENSGNDVSSAAHTKAKGKGGNSAAAHEHAREQHEKAHAKPKGAKAKGQGHGKAAARKESSPPGHSARTRPPASSKTEGSSSNHSSTTDAPHSPHTPQGAAESHSEVPDPALEITSR
jgi:hypothetical protein